jgi:SET domain-containing protein
MTEMMDFPMAIYTLKESVHKGVGVFAARYIVKNEHIFHRDLSSLQSYSLQEIDRLAKEDLGLNGDRTDYIGHGRYVFDNSPMAFMNHSCDPNCYVKMRSIAIKDVYALRDIEKDEELTHDYTATSVDQFAGKGFWVLNCRCGSENCRGHVTGDFFEMPYEWQMKYYPYLAPSIKRKYRDRLRNLLNRS